jgi:hypothetical protein
MWAYYDRRVAQHEPGPHNVLSYFRDLGVQADLDSINSELDQVTLRLRQLPPRRFLDLGAGPSGQFTRELAGDGLAIDQSAAALRSLRSVAPSLAVVRADAMRIPGDCHCVPQTHQAGLDPGCQRKCEDLQESDSLVELLASKKARAVECSYFPL